MRQTLTTIAVALAVIVALFGAVGFVSADTTDQEQNPQTNGPVGPMADHAPGQFGEMMQGMAGEHVPGMHSDDHEPGEHHAEHEPGEHHAEHEPGEHHAEHESSERHAGNGGHC